MSDVLAQINAHKLSEIAQLQKEIGLAELEARAAQAAKPRGFINALKVASHEGYGLIAELKKASPSKGLIRADFEPVSLAKAYEAGGASCLSILTDERYFQGHRDYLVAARATTHLPVLRKDFMIDPLQIIEARALGADAILLIMASLSDKQAQELEALAHELGMDVLIEVHDASELERACALTSPLMGINNRNLKTMEISLDVGAAMLPRLPSDRIAVAESGLFEPEDLAYMAGYGARCFLIGESLMRQDDVTSATKKILSNPVKNNQ